MKTTDNDAAVVAADAALSPSAEGIRFLDNSPPRPSEKEVPDSGHRKPCALEVITGAPGCQRCQTLPVPITNQTGVLWLCFPQPQTISKVLPFLVDSGYHCEEQNNTLCIRVEPGEILALLAPLLDIVSPAEQQDTRAFFQSEGNGETSEGTVTEFKIESLPDFADRLRSEWLLRLLREERFYSVFQPILRSGDAGTPTTVFGYECLLRGRDDRGETVTPDLMLRMARSADILFQFDLTARRTAIASAAAKGIAHDHKVFINFVPTSIYNPKTCLESTVRLVDALGIKRNQIVFEITESERMPELSHLRRIVDYYREQGFGVALDDVGAGFSSLSALAALRPDYVKIDRSLIQKVHEDAGQAVIARKLLEIVRELGIQSVAEGIETEAEFAWAKAHGADFVQGYLFARPAEIPPLLH